MAEREEEQKSLLTKMKEESKKSGLKLNIQKTKILASVPSFTANRWERLETVAYFIFLGSKITEDGDRSREVKTLSSWRKRQDKPS